MMYVKGNDSGGKRKREGRRRRRVEEEEEKGREGKAEEYGEDCKFKVLKSVWNYDY